VHIFVLITHCVIVVIAVFIELFRYCIFKIYSAVWLSSCKCVINSVFSVSVSEPWSGCCETCQRNWADV